MKIFSTLFFGFIIGIWTSVGMLELGFKPRAARVVADVMILRDRGIHISVDNRLRVWMWNPQTKTSINITNDLSNMAANVK